MPQPYSSPKSPALSIYPYSTVLVEGHLGDQARKCTPISFFFTVGLR